MLRKQIIITAIIIFTCKDVLCQQGSIHEHISNHFKEVAMSCLKKIYPNENFLEREVARGNSIDTVRNYYHYNSFSLSFGRDNEDLVIINFGAFIEHSPVYMLVFKVTGQNFGNQLLLGNQSLENDLKSLQSVFCCWGLKINEECKIEILDIYLQSKQGKLKTSIYKH